MIYDYGKTIYSGTLLEVYRFEKAPRLASSTGRRRKSSDSTRSSTPGPRRWDSVKRLRRNFTRLVQTQLAGKGAPAFLTLTFVSNADIEFGLLCFKDFNRRAKKEFGDSFSFIAVPEFQKRGAIHFHLLVWGIADHYVKKERATRYIQSLWARGFVDIIPTDGSPKLASYLSKYMQKALQDPRLYGRRAYYCSRNVMRPVLYKTSAVVNYAKEILGVDIELLTERNYSTQWLGAGNYQVYKVIDHGQSSN